MLYLEKFLSILWIIINFKTLLGVVVAIQFTVPALIGALIAMKFDLSPLAIAVVSSAAYVGSGQHNLKMVLGLLLV